MSAEMFTSREAISEICEIFHLRSENNPLYGNSKYSNITLTKWSGRNTGNIGWLNFIKQS